MKVDRKTNEITVMPQMLRLLDIKGCVITADAMGCQTEIAQLVIETGGHYVLSVKDNQPSLRHDIETSFKALDTPPLQDIPGFTLPAIENFHSIEKGHGRIEERKVRVCRDLSWLSEPERFNGLGFFAEVIRKRHEIRTGKNSEEVAYYIGSDISASAEQIGKYIRRHWSIENECHWTLDMAFREDEARHRAKNVANNMSALRKFALNIIKGDKNRKLGVANSRKIAGWDLNYLIKLLTESNA